VPNTQSGELYQYRSYLETLMIYDTDVAAMHLTNSFWYLDKGDMVPCELTAAQISTKNSIHHPMEQN